MKTTMPTALLAALLALPCILRGQEFTIKFATVAPEGSTWMNVMKEYDRAVRSESGGRLGFKMYPGGVQGDEKDVLRKIGIGQLHAAGVTGNGLTTIAPKARILDCPFLFRSYAEADRVIEMFNPEFDRAFQDNGYVNLGWAEVGFVYVFTNSPARSPEELRRVKMWMWEGDPVAEATFTAIGVHPIPLSITDVLTSLQTRLVDGVYTTPLAAIALQWFTRVRYMMNTPLADAAGAVVVSRKKYESLPPDLRGILLSNGKKYMRRLTELTRADSSIATLRRNGITVLEPASPGELSSFEEIGARTRRMLAGKLFDAGLLDRVEAALREFRTKAGKGIE